MTRPAPRPPIDARLLSPDGAVVQVMARWSGGVVFDNETTATNKELERYTYADTVPSPPGR